tara:strand:+ start:142 stop:1191 length:1050 start_codon:yes stop_codon:yes gene_type:complete
MNLINPYRHAASGYVGDGSYAMEFTTTSPNTTVYLPIRSSDSSGRLVFDDGTSDVIGNPDQATHTFANAGTYVIKYYGTATSLAWGSSASTANKQFLTKILDWGITGATSAKFENCRSLISVASNLESTTTNISNLIRQGGDADLSLLDTSNVTNMGQALRNNSFFNHDVNGWNTSNVTDMNGMFNNSTSFNQPLNNWDVSNHNGDFSWFFGGASSFNQDISGWDVSNATNMSGMFYDASDFNQDISSWDVSSVTNMSYLFYDATSANPDMSLWNFSSVTNYGNFLAGAGISTTNYDGFLNKLNADRITYSLTGRAIGDIPSTYTTSVSGAARTALLANGWTFTDDGGI